MASLQIEIDQLRTVAAEKFEAANEATLKIKRLERETQALNEQGSIAKERLFEANRVLAAIAVNNYKNSGLGQGLELLFSTDPAQYLSDASALKIVEARYSKQARDFAVWKQRVKASVTLLEDRTAKLTAEKITLNREVAAAKLALRTANKKVNSLKKEDRERLLREESSREKKIFKDSKKYASAYKGDNSRGSIALRFALKQIGDIYVWGAAGPTRWDCSGLTMRAFQAAGISLPHFSGAQIKYGKSVSYTSLKPGDLMFYGIPNSHVSMYMGGGKMVQAPRPGKKVEVIPITRMFGYKPFVGARRL
ncbi:MAG: C40 family peptidase [SAR202 cluster bacterium]|nr:C40 family peptidase [SAR202 cluster bacterium]